MESDLKRVEEKLDLILTILGHGKTRSISQRRQEVEDDYQRIEARKRRKAEREKERRQA